MWLELLGFLGVYIFSVITLHLLHKYLLTDDKDIKAKKFIPLVNTVLLFTMVVIMLFMCLLIGIVIVYNGVINLKFKNSDKTEQ